MLNLNKMFRKFMLLLIHTVTLLEMYLLSVITTGAILSVVFSVWSLIKPLPLFVSTNYWTVLLLASVPLCIVYFVIVELDVLDVFTDYRYKVIKKRFEKRNKNRKL